MKQFTFPRRLAAMLACMVLSLLLSVAALAQSISPAPITAPPPQVQSDTNSKFALNVAPVAIRPSVTFKAQGGGKDAYGPWSGAVFCDLRGGINAVVLNKITDLSKGTRYAGFGLYAFAGTAVNKDGKLTAGIAFGKDWQLLDQISIFTGVGIAVSADRKPVGGGLLLGASFHFQ